MLKKIAVLAFAAAAMLPAAPAGAWEQVCMKLPLWKTWFSGNFHIVYDFHTYLGELPDSYYVRETRSSTALPEELNASSRVRADGYIKSSSMHVNQTKCVDISEISQGDAFFLYFQPDLGKAVLCETHHSNPDKWYHQTNRPYRTLNYESTGSAAHPKCRYTHES